MANYRALRDVQSVGGEMTPSQQNEAIAKWMGVHYHKPTEDEVKSGSYYQYEPDYANDLNQMSTAETKLRNLGGFGWTDYLRNLGLRDDVLDMSNEEFWKLACAPVEKRAWALLKTIKLWTE